MIREIQTKQYGGEGKGREGRKKDRIQKWGYNMVMAARVTEIESGE